MSAPAYLPLQGQTPIEIDHAYYPVVTGFNRRKSTPVTKKKTATHVGKALGIPDVTGSFQIMVTETGLAQILALRDFSISYTWSGTRYTIMHCDWSEDDRGVNPANADNTMTLNFEGTVEIP